MTSPLVYAPAAKSCLYYKIRFYSLQYEFITDTWDCLRYQLKVLLELIYSTFSYTVDLICSPQ
jgi:hypothetical protein